MFGDFPPNSKVTFLIVSAAPFMMFFPTDVEPVKATFLIFGCCKMAFPQVRPLPGITAKTPAGSPACLNKEAAYKLLKGVALAGLMTMQLPVANEGPTFQENMRSGKFQGVIAPHTPKGSLLVYVKYSGPVSMVRPSTLSQ